MRRSRQPKHSVFRHILDQQYDESVRYKLLNSVKGSQDWVQRLGLLRTLPIHSGCVNCICWNETGERLLSGSDDQHLIITNGYNYKILTDYKTSHRANIFSAKFLPRTGDTGLVSCSGDGVILYTDLMRLDETHNNRFHCHIGTTYEITTIPNDPNMFLSCGEDYTVRCFDLRVKEKCNKTRCTEDVIICCQRPVTALTVNATYPHQLAIGCSDSTVRLYDRRMLGAKDSIGDPVRPIDSYVAPGMDGRSFRITSLSFSPGGEDILVSYSSEHLYLFGIKDSKTVTLKQELEIPDKKEADSEESPVVGSSCSVAPVRRLRLRGDWSDTGPDARPQNESTSSRASVWQARPTLHGTLMQRMTDVLSRMLNDPATRAALSHGGEDTFPETDDQSSQTESQPATSQESQENVPAPAQAESSVGTVSVDIGGYSGTNETQEECPGTSEPETSTAPRENVPMDLPLPSFRSTYSSFINPATSEQPQASEEPAPEAEQRPSTSRNEEVRGEDQNLTNLKNQLSTMCNGFIEKHGTEPIVNLVYSDKGSTASRISMSVADEVTRASTSMQPSSSDGTQEMQVDEEAKVSPTSEILENSPSQDSSADQTAEEAVSESELNEDDYGDSDDDMEPVVRSECRIVHPIEKHMDEAIKSVRGESSKAKEDVLKVRRSTLKQKYVGHRNARTMIKEATFWGNDYVISGSDCGHVFMWERESAKLRMLLEADHHVVNCVQPHPHLPILATSGIDYDVKLWAPVHQELQFDVDKADELMKRNAVMLEETKDTITVPASFMIRMLACLNQIRRGARPRLRRRDPSVSSD